MLDGNNARVRPVPWLAKTTVRGARVRKVTIMPTGLLSAHVMAGGQGFSG